MVKNVLSLRPCQFVLGMREVENKVKKLKRMAPKQRKKYIKDRTVPVVKMGKNLYIIDNHHFVRACWEVGVKKVPVKIISTIHECSCHSFWNLMSQHNWTYLTDQFGTPERNPLLLPNDIRCMADDPYRSLAWAAREAGAFDKVAIPFSEFRWANYLRHFISIEDVRDNFKRAVKDAIKVCSNKGASKLPGYKK